MVILNWTAESVEVERDGEWQTDVVVCVNGAPVARKNGTWTGDDPERISEIASDVLGDVLRRNGARP